MVTVNKLVAMLQYMRPAYSFTEHMFCREYLEPVFGLPDVHGNYVKIVGDNPTICFTAHTDTVHRGPGGIQTIKLDGDIVSTVDGNCLGADCTTGLWLMLYMIDAGVEGVYVAHAAEEIGGIGSTALVADNPPWLDYIQACISFDRYGETSIITHQSAGRTASDNFARSLATVLDLPMRPDQYGTYTDSYEYADVVSECTNISVGYNHQHTSSETQDLHFVQVLAERLVAADWSRLVIERDPSVPERWGHTSYMPYSPYTRQDADSNEVEAMERLLIDRPGQLAALLVEYGFTVETTCEELGLDYLDVQNYLGDDEYNYYCH